MKIYGYDYVYCYIEEKDSMSIDNSFYLYGGTPQPLRIQYYSTRTNNFVGGILMGLRAQLREDWDIEIVEMKDSEKAIQEGHGLQPEITGFDIYIFEHHVPDIIPSDGLVIIINPKKLPKDVEVMLGSELAYRVEKELNSGSASSDILKYTDPSNITITRYRQINAYDGSFTPILFVDDNPVAIVKNEPAQKIMLFSFSLHYSNLAVTPEFPLMMKNAIRDFFDCCCHSISCVDSADDCRPAFVALGVLNAYALNVGHSDKVLPYLACKAVLVKFFA